MYDLLKYNIFNFFYKLYFIFIIMNRTELKVGMNSSNSYLLLNVFTSG